MEREMYKAMALPPHASVLAVARKARKLVARSCWRDPGSRGIRREFLGRMIAIHKAARGPRHG